MVRQQQQIKQGQHASKTPQSSGTTVASGAIGGASGQGSAYLSALQPTVDHGDFSARSQIMSATLGTGPLAGRGIDLIVYGLIIVLIAALRPTGILSLPWSRWVRRLAGHGPGGS